MLSPEQNDVDISKLFNWGKKIDVLDDRGQNLFSCHMRLIGDAEINRARVLALRQSAELRRKLVDVTTEENLAFIIPIDSFENDGLMSYIAAFKIRDFTKIASKQLDMPFPKELKSDASIEEQEKYQAAVDSYPQRYEDKLKDEVGKLLDKELDKLRTQSKETLYEMYKKLVIDNLCETQMLESLRDYMVYFGTYRDDDYKVRLFKTFDEFDNLPSTIKNQLVDAYDTLEINVDDLKK